MFEEFSETPIFNTVRKLYCKDGIYRLEDSVGNETENKKYLNTNEQKDANKYDILYILEDTILPLAEEENFKDVLKRVLLQFIKS